MLPPGIVLFTPAALVGSPRRAASPVDEALAEVDRRNIPLVLCTSGTRAQLELFRRKLGHGHPFITESGGGLFIPDGYFALRIEGARRRGRYLCVPFGRSADEASEAVQDIAAATGAEVVRYSEMSTREISRNAGINEREAEASREREFSEGFYFAGNADSATPAFERMAIERGWRVRSSEIWWELYAGNDEGNAARRVTQLYRQALRSRVKAVGLGASAEDLSLLAASDQAFLIPQPDGQLDQVLVSRLPRAKRTSAPGFQGWNETVLNILSQI
jgi:mannosyl-3-phosphoglycerate phosphatase